MNNNHSSEAFATQPCNSIFKSHRTVIGRQGPIKLLHAFSGLTGMVERSLRRALAIGLVISLLASSTPAAASTIVGVSREWQLSLAFWMRTTQLPARIYRALGGQEHRAEAQERQEERDGRVSRITVYPGDITIRVEEKVNLAAVAYDRDGNAVGGVRMKWSARDEGRNHGVRISPSGEFESVATGTYIVVAEGAGKRGHARITVIDGTRRNSTEAPLRRKQVSTRDLPEQQSSRQADKAKDIKSAHASRRRGLSAAAAAPLINEEWGDGNYWSADDPGNRRGDPPGQPLDDGAGSGNFQLAAPVLALPARGISLSLTLAYNSRLWNKSGSNINYDIDRDWPAPGWSLGFGKVVDMGAGGSMLVDADGTRHGFSGTITTFSWGQEFKGHTTDGSLIDYKTWKNSSGVMQWAEVNLPNGSQIKYNAQGPGGVFPTFMIDANGNFITITYVNNTGPRIQTITDTLGRLINFHYDSGNRLTAITAPGLSSGTRTLVRLHYRQISLNYSFSGLTPFVRDANPWVLDAIYYPATGTGFWFGDSAATGYSFGNTDSYSTYGMLAKVVETRAMTFSGPDPVPPGQGTTEQGTITAGQLTRKEQYNYPLFVGDTSGTTSSNLNDAPTFTSQTESWTRDGVNVDQAVTSYEVHQNTSPRTVTVTLPNGTKNTQYSNNAPNQWNDGLVIRDETYVNSQTILQRSTTEWEQGAYGSPRPKRLEFTNEKGQTRATQLNYGTVFNQLIEVRDFDYGGTTLLRSTRTQYQNSASYTTNRHIFNLPLIVEVFAADDVTRVSRKEYQYDGQPLVDAPGVVMHDVGHNPYAPEYQVEYCAEWDHWQINCLRWESYWTTDYNPVTDARGNITQITTYANAANLTGAVTETRTFDIAGNFVKLVGSCCDQTTITYTDATQYAYPTSQTRGSATDPYAQVTSTGTYDFGTGLALSATDVNGRTTVTSYDPGSLRPLGLTLPTGAHTHNIFDDAGMQVTTTSFAGAHSASETVAAGKNIKLLNGHGQVRQEQALGASGWDLVDTEYNSMGDVFRQTFPYRSGQTPQYTTTSYDALGRVTRVTNPDGSSTETYYNEVDFDTTDSYAPQRPNVVSASAPGETVLARDGWGRERWGRADASERLVEVVEPNPSVGNSVATGGLLTTYGYDTVGNLTSTLQGEQTRSFRFDDLGRMTAQKLAETSATLDVAGNYVGSGTWSDVFTYDNRSNITSRTDARGVKTFYNFNNDPFNRLQSITYDTTADPNHSLQPGHPNYYLRVLDTATVTFQYRTKGSPTELKDVTQLAGVASAGVSTVTFAYDPEGRMNKKTMTLSSRPSHPMTIDYIYDSLDRITDVFYPPKDLVAQSQSSRKHVHQDYQLANRPSLLTVDSQSYASNMIYNAASQITSLKVGASITENYAYEAQSGFLSNQTVVRDSDPQNPLLDLTYQYTDTNGKRTGQLTKILNNRNHNKDRSYTYDALGRLVQAKGGVGGALWTQNYSYDRYGNRTSVTASGTTAINQNGPTSTAREPVAQAGSKAGANSQSMRQAVASGTVAEPKVILPSEQLAARTEVELPEAMRNEAPRPLSDSSFNSGARPSRTKAAVTPNTPPVFTDDPLGPGVTIKAVHITELRDAINQARSLAALGAASWTDNTLPGVAVKTVHITEMRARLNEARTALGLAPASYTDPTLSAGSPVKAVHVQELRQRVTEALTTSSACPPPQVLSTDQFVKNFYQGALNRQPNSAELQSWTEQLRQANSQGQAQQLAVAQYLGQQLFTSVEYANRNRNNSEFVYDLYKGYLQREPDQAGWDSWTSQVPQVGRDNVRAGFAWSTEFANKVASLCPLSSAGSGPIPQDGIGSLSYDAATNRITTAGFSYDAAGNQTRALAANGGSQRFQYDAANRMVNVQTDAGQIIAAHTYGATNERLITEEFSVRTYFAWGDEGAVLAEYVESGGSTTPIWSKIYIYLGTRLLSTIKPNSTGGEYVQYNHSDRLGTVLVTNASDNTYFEQQTLPFGTALQEAPNPGATTGVTNRRFTTYDRSISTGLDYALNRHYDAQQGRFTQVDPSGMTTVSLASPQTLNLYAYCTNDPINHTDPSGLGFFSFLKKLFKWIAIAMAIIVAVIAVITIGAVPLLETIRLILTAGSLLSHAMGWKKLARIFDIGLAIINAYYAYEAAKRNVIIWNYKEGDEYPTGEMRIANWATLIGTIANYLQGSKKKGGKKTKQPDKKQVDNKDPEAPCVNKGANVRRDINRIAYLIGGKVKPGSVYTGQRFPGGGIDPRGQSISALENKLLKKGFQNNYSFGHSEGRGFHSKKAFKSGLWYHVIVNYADNEGYFTYDPAKPAPVVTVHCHGTDPHGWEHLKDTVKPRWWPFDD